MFGNQGVGDFFQVAVHHKIQLVQGKVDAVVGHATLRVVVGTDALAAVAAADKGFAFGGFFGLGFAFLRVVQAGGEDFHRLRLVGVLAAAVLAFDHHACGQVGDADGGVGFVDVLTARTGCAEGVDAQVGGVQFDVLYKKQKSIWMSFICLYLWAMKILFTN